MVQNIPGIEIPPEWNAQGIDRTAGLRKSASRVGHERGPIEAIALIWKTKLLLSNKP